MDHAFTDAFSFKLKDFSQETTELMSKSTINNYKLMIYTFLNSIVSNYIENINMLNDNPFIILIQTFVLRQINNFFFALYSQEHENVSSIIYRKNNEIINTIDSHFQHYYLTPKYSTLLHNYYLCSFSHHAITCNLFRSLCDLISCCLLLLNRKNISLFDYGRICFFLNSVFNHYINSIERTEIKIASSEKTNTHNRDTITDFVGNQNIIYNCSQEEQFLSKIMRSYNDVNDIDKSYYKDCLITPEHYNNETLYYEQLAMLRFFVKLEPFDIHVLELIRYYLRLVTIYSIQLRDISNKLNNLDIESLKDFSFKSTTIVGEPDYKYPLFTIDRMVFSHDKNNKPYLFEVDRQMKIPSSKWIYFKGNSGTGKTTLIQLLLRIITNNNTKFFQYEDYDMNSIRKYIIFVKSNGDIFNNETVEYNVTFGIPNPPLSILQHYFTLFEIGVYEDIKDKNANTLSTGEKQRIRIIHTILQLMTDDKKRILILDEITSNIDETCETIVLSELRRLQKEYKLSVMHISHSSEHVMYSDLLMTIDNRRLCLGGT